ncbi:MAG: hypothetical protein ACR2IE_07365 [Candidatus Sumerlaeaceae bacterium]
MSASATSTPPEGTTTNVRCPRCHHGNDTDALQCTHCGEMLQKVHYGVTNRAAIVRDAIGAPSADPGVISAELHAYDPAVLAPTIMRLLLTALGIVLVAGLTFGASWLLIDYGPQLQIAAGVICGLAAIPVVIAVAVWITGKSREFATRRLANVALRRVQLKTERERAIRRSLRASGKSALAGEHLVTPPEQAVAPSQAFRISLSHDSPVLNPTTYKVLASAAAFTFVFLPQYQVVTNYSGLECIKHVMTFLLRRQKDFMSIGSFAALAIPLLLANQVYLAFRRRPGSAGILPAYDDPTYYSSRKNRLRTPMWNATATLILMLIVYLSASTGHDSAAAALRDRFGVQPDNATRLAELQTLVFGFQYGYFVTGLLVAASAGCGWMRMSNCRGIAN